MVPFNLLYATASLEAEPIRKESLYSDSDLAR